MFIRSSLSDAEIAEGFSPSNDIFKQKDFGLRLTSLYSNLPSGTVSLFDGRWGIGKTTFIRMWAAHLQSKNIPTIYLDAFLLDYLDSPFEALAGAIVQRTAELGREDQPVFKKFISRAARVGRLIGGTVAKVGIKAGTLGLIGASEIDSLVDIGDSLSDTLSEKVEKEIQAVLDKQSESMSSFAALKNSLDLLPQLLIPIPSNKDLGFRPLIFIIDELDRCRPDFALGILETLKHFFSVRNIHFVLVTNRSHLQLSVQHRYGVGAAAGEYLEKFYDFLIHYELNYDKNREGSSDFFVSRLLKKVFTTPTQEMNDIEDYVRSSVRAFSLSLRQIEAVITNISLSYFATKEGDYRPSVLVTFLCLIKAIDPDLFRKAKNGKMTLVEFRQFVNLGNWQNSDIEHVKSVFEYHLSENIDENAEEWRGYKSMTFRYNFARSRVISYLANSVIDRFGAASIN